MKKKNSIVKVDLARIRHNLDVIGSHLHAGVKQMAVIKADAYGHGSVKVAEAVHDKADWLAVNDVAEAVELREAGINTPVLVFEVPEKEEAELYTRYKLTATISSAEHFDILPAGTGYHLNVDTGMGRLGFLPEQLPVIKQKMKEAGALTCTGIYSHFATADRPNSALASGQLAAFRDIRSEFAADLPAHMCNTGGSVFYPGAQFNMVRTGIGMYGYAPGAAGIPGLKPALTWETRLVHVKKIKKGATVSYDAVWETPEEGYIGVIPVGYEDGIRRNLTGKLEVNIGGRIYPAVGTITMNYTMVYLGEEPLPVHTAVHLFDGETLTAAVWAGHLQTIPYEILTGITDKIPRIYEE